MEDLVESLPLQRSDSTVTMEEDTETFTESPRSESSLSVQDFEIIRVLGAGASGKVGHMLVWPRVDWRPYIHGWKLTCTKVFLVRKISNQKIYALKAINKKSLNNAKAIE